MPQIVRRRGRSPLSRSKLKSAKLKSANSNRFNSRLYLGVVGCTAALVATPVLIVLGHLVGFSGTAWQHLAQTVLPQYLLNSFVLMVGVGLGTLILGVSTAWCVTLCRFPGQRFFEWALLLPLAVPAYVLAYTYTDFLDVAGPVQTLLRSLLGLEVRQYWFPNIRSIGGAIAMLTLALYPYIYMLAKVAFFEQAQNTLEASRGLGSPPWHSFRTVALPLARPSIVAGLSLVLMETLSDFGTVQYFGVDTFTTGIYRTWAGLGDPVQATQLAAILLLGVLGLLILEQWSRGQARYYQSGARKPSAFCYDLKGWTRIGVWVWCGIPLGLGFVLPTVLLIILATQSLPTAFNEQFGEFAAHSLVLAIAAATLSVVLSTILAYSTRLYPSPVLKSVVRVAAMGYAIPGSVIAVGISIPLGWAANSGNAVLQTLFGMDARLVFSGTVGALIFAYMVRFLAVSFGTVEASLGKIKPNLDDAARNLGCTPLETLTKIHAPLIWSGLVTATILVFVDTMKELPATLMIRPFNFDTLAVRVYQLASDERLAEAAGPALAVVAVGLLPVIVLSTRLSSTQFNSRRPDPQPDLTSTPLDLQS